MAAIQGIGHTGSMTALKGRGENPGESGGALTTGSIQGQNGAATGHPPPPARLEVAARPPSFFASIIQ